MDHLKWQLNRKFTRFLMINLKTGAMIGENHENDNYILKMGINVVRKWRLLTHPAKLKRKITNLHSQYTLIAILKER